MTNSSSSLSAATVPSWDNVDKETAAPSGQPCSACGCPVEDDDKFCPACGTVQPTHPTPPVPSAASGTTSPGTSRGTAIVTPEIVSESSSASAGSISDQKYFRCQNCSSEVSTSPDTRSYICPFCDSTYVVEFSPEATGRQAPEFIIGFAVAPHEAQEKFQQWISQRGWLQPGDLSRAMIADKMKGVYLPFWSFSMLAQSRWNANIGEHWYETETYTDRDANGRTVTKTRRVQRTEWWPLAGAHHRHYSGYLVSGSRGLPQAEADRIQPFQLPALKRYEPYFLAGWLCEEYSVSREEALQQCQQMFYQLEQQNIASFLPGDAHSSVEVQTRFGKISSDLCLLPVYVLSYRYKDKLYRFVVNGQTGRVAGDKPTSWNRVGCAIAAGIGLVIAIFLLITILGNR